MEELTILFLPAYSSEFAPVEIVFSHIKSKIKRMNISDKSSFYKLCGKEIIYDALKEVSRESIFNVWMNVILTAKKHVIIRLKMAAN